MSAEKADDFSGPYPAIPLTWRAGILAVVVCQFLVFHGAIWRHQFAWDRSILWSYASIPVLVLVALLVRHRLGWISWFLHTLEIACVKFLITASILLGLLISTRNEPPPLRPPALPPPAAAIRRPALPPTPIDPRKTGGISGVVVDRTGSPVAGAIAFISSGLGEYRFASPSTVLVIENDGTRFNPSLTVAESGQPIEARSTNGQLHTLLLKAHAGSWVRNIPLLSSGVANALPTEDMDGVFSLQCTVHGAREGVAYLGIFRHPYFSVTGDDGRFQFQAMPEGSLSVTAFRPGRSGTPQAVTVEPGVEAQVRVILDQSSN
jgi:hypothetical protein